MRARPAIIAALPREVGTLVKGWSVEKLPGKVVVYSNERAVVACAGMGPARASLAVQAAMATGPVSALISAGLAGACDPAMKVGEVVRADMVIDSKTGERFGEMKGGQVLVTSSAIVSVREKARMRAAYHAAAVDMEAATVVRLAEAHGLRFSAVKTISDTADFEVHGLSRFATADGQFHEGAFALYAALRPSMWGKLIALARNSGKALAALTEALGAELDLYERE